MTIFINTIVAITGAYLVIMSLINTTKNTASAILFKVIPMFLGLGCMLAALILFGVI